MKSINKFLTMLAALLLTASSLFSAATVFAAGTTTTSVTVHKLLATDGDMDKIANELETGNYAGNKVGVLPANAKEIAGVMFVWTNTNNEIIDENGQTLGVNIDPQTFTQIIHTSLN